MRQEVRRGLMAIHLRQFVPSRKRSRSHDKAILRTVTILIPRSYNPDERGSRKPVELSKLVRTFREVRRLSSGYSLQQTEGWYRSRETGKGVRDRHFRLDIDLQTTPLVIANLRAWTRTLEHRFDQESIYVRLSKETTWL
jgi:hypothetical protein